MGPPDSHGMGTVMWEAGVFDRMPDGVDHATVGVEPMAEGWAIYMRDVSRHLFPPEGRVAPNEIRRVIGGLAELHRTFLGAGVERLCSLVDRYHLLSPRTAQREIALANPAGPLISRCWDVFVDLAPQDVSGPIVALAEDSTPLAAELSKCQQTLVHGDARPWNMGLNDTALVMIDWGERTGMAPAPVEIASFLAFDAKYLDLTRDEVIEEYRSLTSDFVDDTSVDLAMIGGLVQLGCNHVLDLVLKGTEDARRDADDPDSTNPSNPRTHISLPCQLMGQRDDDMERLDGVEQNVEVPAGQGRRRRERRSLRHPPGGRGPASAISARSWA